MGGQLRFNAPNQSYDHVLGPHRTRVGLCLASSRPQSLSLRLHEGTSQPGLIIVRFDMTDARAAAGVLEGVDHVADLPGLVARADRDRIRRDDVQGPEAP